jgi:hypothetical protein
MLICNKNTRDDDCAARIMKNGRLTHESERIAKG